MHGDPQTFLRQPEHLSEERPCKADGIVLEIIAKTEVAQHFEKGVVPRRIAYVFQVIVFPPRPDAALRRSGTTVWPLLDTQKNILELHHAGIGKQQRWVVVGHQAATGHNSVPLAGKILQESITYFSTFHKQAGSITLNGVG